MTGQQCSCDGGPFWHGPEGLKAAKAVIKRMREEEEAAAEAAEEDDQER